MKRYQKLKKELPKTKKRSKLRKVLKVAGVTLAVNFLAAVGFCATLSLTPHTELPNRDKIQEKLDFYDADSTYMSLAQNFIIQSPTKNNIITRRQVKQGEVINLMVDGSAPEELKQSAKFTVDYYNLVFSKINPDYKFGYIENPTIADRLCKNNIIVKDVMELNSKRDAIGRASFLPVLGKNGVQACYGSILLERAVLFNEEERNAVMLHEMAHHLGFYDAYLLQEKILELAAIGKEADFETTSLSIMSSGSEYITLMPNDLYLLDALYGKNHEPIEYEEMKEQLDNFIYNYVDKYKEYKEQTYKIIEKLPEMESNILNNINLVYGEESTSLDISYELGSSIRFIARDGGMQSETSRESGIVTLNEMFRNKTIISADGNKATYNVLKYNFQGPKSCTMETSEQHINNIDGKYYYYDRGLLVLCNGHLLQITEYGINDFMEYIEPENYQTEIDKFQAEVDYYEQLDTDFGGNYLQAQSKKDVAIELENTVRNRVLKCYSEELANQLSCVEIIDENKPLHLKRVEGKYTNNNELRYFFNDNSIWQRYSYKKTSPLLSSDCKEEFIYKLSDSLYAVVSFGFDMDKKLAVMSSFELYEETNDNLQTIQEDIENYKSQTK